MQIAFDLGNVLVKIDNSVFGYTYHSICNTTQDYEIFLNAIQSLQDTGLLTIKQALRNKFGDSVLPFEKRLAKAWNGIIRPHTKMIKFVDSLKDQGIDVAILSNIGHTHAALMRAKYPEIFDGCKLHLSCEQGIRKPTKLYFQTFLWENPGFKGCPYVDDLPENLAMGAQCGLKPHNFNLDSFDTMSKSEQDAEIDKIKRMVFDRVLYNMPA